MSELTSAPPLPRLARLAEQLAPWLLAASLVVLAAASLIGLVFAPADWRQGETVRILYVHVSAAWMSLFCWGILAAAGVAVLWRRCVFSAAVFEATAWAGFWFTALALITGSIWGRAIWGLWWAWDARLVSELILLFLYLGTLSLPVALQDRFAGVRTASILALVGLVHLPIIKFSVVWWISLHQTSSVFAGGESRLPEAFLVPLVLMALAYLLLYGTLVCLRAPVGYRRLAPIHHRETHGETYGETHKETHKETHGEREA